MPDIDVGVPIELQLPEALADEGLFKHYSQTLAGHSLRVSIPASAQVYPAVSTAAKAGCPVRLEVGQPSDVVINEMLRVVDMYLHDPEIEQPVEFFHTLLLSFFRGEQRTLWEIQDEDPAKILYVTDDDRASLSRRLACLSTEEASGEFLMKRRRKLMLEQGECSRCEFFGNCIGYFKLPNEGFGCSGVIRLLRLIKEASLELREDNDLFAVSYDLSEDTTGLNPE